MESEKRIEVCKVRAGDLKADFWNPRKITKKRLEELERSFELLGDFGIFVIDEENRVIAGNQRLKVILNMLGPDAELDCKRMIGYSEDELKAVNVKDNTHVGEWNLDMLNSWVAETSLDFSIDREKPPGERGIRDMELIRYEKYDYVMIVCRNEPDYLQLTRLLGINDAKCLIAGKRRIKARAIWYDDMKAQIVPKPETAKKTKS